MEESDKKIGVVGHVDHGKTTLNAAITAILNDEGVTDVESYNSAELTLENEIIRDRSYSIINTKFIGISPAKPSRRERRKAERKAKKKD